MPSGGRQLQFGDKCIDCNVVLDKFNGVFKRVYLQPRCKRCNRAHTEANPSRNKEARKVQYMQWKWGLSLLEYRAKSEAQGNVCAICKKTCRTGRELAVDHDHATNKIRDLLCYSCNTMLGLIEEDINTLQAMIEYIKKHQEEIA